jgi:hypothetical protein
VDVIHVYDDGSTLGYLRCQGGEGVFRVVENVILEVSWEVFHDDFLVTDPDIANEAIK